MYSGIVIYPEIRPHPLIPTLTWRLPLFRSEIFRMFVTCSTLPARDWLYAFVLIKCLNIESSCADSLHEIKSRTGENLNKQVTLQ